MTRDSYWTEMQVVRLRIALRAGRPRGEVAARAQHSISECDRMAWFALGRPARVAATLWNHQIDGVQFSALATGNRSS